MQEVGECGGGGGEAEGRAEKRGMEPRGDGVVRVCLPGTPQSVSL